MNEKLKKALSDGTTSELPGKTYAFKLWPRTTYTFGKYKGKTFWEVACKDYDYALWSIRKIPKLIEGFENNKDYMSYILTQAMFVFTKIKRRKSRKKITKWY